MKEKCKLRYKIIVVLGLGCSLVVFHQIGEAKSVVREGDAILTLKEFRCPPETRQGEIFPIDADFSLSKSMWKDGNFFLHITDQKDNKILVNADFVPPVPFIRWTPGQVMKIGPVDMYIPEELPVGVYNIVMGIYVAEVKDNQEIYVREPYTNKEIKDFVLGHVVVKEALPEKEPEPLIISDFKDDVDLYKWEMRDATAERVTVEGSDKTVGKITFLKDSGCPAIILENSFKRSHPRYSNWSYYDDIEFEMYQDKNEKGSTALTFSATMQIKDKTGRRFQEIISPPPEKGKPATYPLHKAANAVDLTQIGNFTLFTLGAAENKIAYLNYVKLVVRKREGEKGPFIKFEGLKLVNATLKPGEVLEFEATFSITRKFIIDHDLFLHIFRTSDGAGHINADTTPTIPTTKWEVNKPVTIGPLAVYIPEDAPAGKYGIEMGLFISRQTPKGARYVKVHKSKDGVFRIDRPQYPMDFFRQPYVNYEQYGDWIVGEFEVVSRQ